LKKKEFGVIYCYFDYTIHGDIDTISHLPCLNHGLLPCHYKQGYRRNLGHSSSALCLPKTAPVPAGRRPRQRPSSPRSLNLRNIFEYLIHYSISLCHSAFFNTNSSLFLRLIVLTFALHFLFHPVFPHMNTITHYLILKNLL